MIDVGGVSRSESSRKTERERRPREWAWGIAGNYLVGKRCVNTGHTVFPRLFRALLSRAGPSSRSPSVSLFSFPRSPFIRLSISFTVSVRRGCVRSLCTHLASSTNFTVRIPCLFVALCPGIYNSCARATAAPSERKRILELRTTRTALTSDLMTVHLTADLSFFLRIFFAQRSKNFFKAPHK